MGKIKKIMVAVDFSTYSPKVVDFAGRMAEDLKAEMVLANVINQRDVNIVRRVTGYDDAVSVKVYVENLQQERISRMDKILQQTGCENLPHRLVFKVGIPFEGLIHLVKEEQVDMVIMGAKGRSNLAGVLFGSTAEKMFRLCPVPLISIR